MIHICRSSSSSSSSSSFFLYAPWFTHRPKLEPIAMQLIWHVMCITILIVGILNTWLQVSGAESNWYTMVSCTHILAQSFNPRSSDCPASWELPVSTTKHRGPHHPW
jgi:hypothetical protein